MEEMGTFCLVWSPLVLGYFYSLVAVEETEEKMWPGWLERAAERLTLGCLFTFSSLPHFRTAGVLGSAHTPELLGQFVLGSHCPFIKLVYSACLEPWLIVFTTRLCSLLILSSVIAVPSTWVHAAQEERVYLETWGHIRALCFLTSFRHRSPSPFASCHMMRVSNQNLCRIACGSLDLSLLKSKIECF